MVQGFSFASTSWAAAAYIQVAHGEALRLKF